MRLTNGSVLMTLDVLAGAMAGAVRERRAKQGRSGRRKSKYSAALAIQAWGN